MWIIILYSTDLEKLHENYELMINVNINISRHTKFMLRHNNSYMTQLHIQRYLMWTAVSVANSRG